MHTDDEFTLFWELVQKKVSEVDVSEPRLPRPRKIPKRFRTIDEEVQFPTTVETYYHDIYFEVLEYDVSTIIGAEPGGGLGGLKPSLQSKMAHRRNTNFRAEPPLERQNYP